MNKTLISLLKKLEWQLTEVVQQLDAVQEDLHQLDKQLQQNQESIENASKTPAFILPEKEIARLHFLMNQHEKQDVLKRQKAEIMDKHALLVSKQLRIKMEIKMLEKYQEKSEEQKQKKTELIQQNTADEWALQRRGA